MPLPRVDVLRIIILSLDGVGDHLDSAVFPAVGRPEPALKRSNAPDALASFTGLVDHFLCRIPEDHRDDVDPPLRCVRPNRYEIPDKRRSRRKDPQLGFSGECSGEGYEVEIHVTHS